MNEERYDGWLVSPDFRKRLLAFVGYGSLAYGIVWLLGLILLWILELI